MAANSTKEETDCEENTSPFVLQCTGCLSVLGDTLAWVCGDQNTRTVSLSGKQNPKKL
jgi:hypothetical protein